MMANGAQDDRAAGGAAGGARDRVVPGRRQRRSGSDFGPKTGIGAALGAAGGGLLGAAAGGGATGIAAGVLLGGLLGGATGSVLDDQDRRTAANTTQQALESKPSGTTSTWTNPDTGHSGSVTPIRTYQAEQRPVLPRVRAERDHRRQAAEELRHRLPAAGRLLADSSADSPAPERNESCADAAPWFSQRPPSVSLAAASPGGARAQSEGEPFSLTDYNKDGRIDRQEYQRRMIEVFYFADRNKDGVVTIEELAAIEDRRYRSLPRRRQERRRQAHGRRVRRLSHDRLRRRRQEQGRRADLRGSAGLDGVATARRTPAPRAGADRDVYRE